MPERDDKTSYRFKWQQLGTTYENILYPKDTIEISHEIPTRKKVISIIDTYIWSGWTHPHPQDSHEGDQDTINIGDFESRAVQEKLPTGAQQDMDVDDSDMPRLTTDDNSQVSIQHQTTPVQSNDTYRMNGSGGTFRLSSSAHDIVAYQAYKEDRVLKRPLSDEQKSAWNSTKKNNKKSLPQLIKVEM